MTDVQKEQIAVRDEGDTVRDEKNAVREAKTAVPIRMLSIWFFVSIVLGVFGLIILAMGIFHYVSPPANPTHKLAHLHADLWWGIVMVLSAAALYVTDRMSKK